MIGADPFLQVEISIYSQALEVQCQQRGRRRKRNGPQAAAPDERRVIHLQCQKRDETTVGDERQAYPSLDALGAEYHHGEQGREAHEAVAEHVDRVQKGIEGLEDEQLDVFGVTPCQPWNHERELHVIDDADKRGVHRGEGHRDVAPDPRGLLRDVVDAYRQHDERYPEEQRRGEKHDQTEGGAATVGATRRPEQSRPFGKLRNDIAQAEDGTENRGPESQTSDRLVVDGHHDLTLAQLHYVVALNSLTRAGSEDIRPLSRWCALLVIYRLAKLSTP